MTEANGWILLWMLIFAAFGFMIGWALGDEVRRRRTAEEQVEQLRQQLHYTITDQLHQLRQIRRVLNDAHRRIHAVSKSLEKRPS